jgi:hypothetical protein
MTHNNPPANLDDRDVLLTNDEAAAYLRMHPGSLERLRSEGRDPPHVRLGRRVLYRLSTLRAANPREAA